MNLFNAKIIENYLKELSDWWWRSGRAFASCAGGGDSKPDCVRPTSDKLSITVLHDTGHYKNLIHEGLESEEMAVSAERRS